MKNIIKISLIVCLGLLNVMAYGQSFNAQNKQQKLSLDQASIDTDFINEGVFTVKIFKSTSRAELDEFKEEADKRNIDLKYTNLEIISGEIEAITIEVDCNDGFSGTASTTDIPDSGIGFIRDYRENAEVPFAIGRIFDQSKNGSMNYSSDDNDDDEFDTAFNKEKSVKKRKSFFGYDNDIEFSIGLNNYLNNNNQFPDNDNKEYSLDPITSWTYGIHSNHVFRTGDYVRFKFQFGLQWNNFALSDNRYQITKGGEKVDLVDTEVTRPDISPERSKLNITYLNLNFIPMFHLGKSSDAFRFGAGPFGSYRIGSKSKFKYNDNGKDVVKNNFYINNWKYGVKAQIGWKGIDLFATYDLSPIFIEDRGPEADYPLRAISFGVIF
ncbi:hypothetical protein [Marivirga arenosa]|uniref:Outer membrane protein beta-barrel domain-containing protein n=1 Tax=Marivirga arenosa TaxID=3059076 RepID=A0AA51ZXN5_9BACT|nr:hypothetical protein [Marivirga sp. BKB1-2]WNB18641.1 hypothetical protein QYS47_30840 [Marivirga sp. BKB1-2]